MQIGRNHWQLWSSHLPTVVGNNNFVVQKTSSAALWPRDRPINGPINHGLLQVTSVICRSQSLPKAGCPQQRLPTRQTSLNYAAQTTLDNWQALTSLRGRSSQNISLFYCDLQHLQDPHNYYHQLYQPRTTLKQETPRLLKCLTNGGRNF